MVVMISIGNSILGFFVVEMVVFLDLKKIELDFALQIKNDGIPL